MQELVIKVPSLIKFLFRNPFQWVHLEFMVKIIFQPLCCGYLPCFKTKLRVPHYLVALPNLSYIPIENKVNEVRFFLPIKIRIFNILHLFRDFGDVKHLSIIGLKLISGIFQFEMRLDCVMLFMPLAVRIYCKSRALDSKILLLYSLLVLKSKTLKFTYL